MQQASETSDHPAVSVVGARIERAVTSFWFTENPRTILRFVGWLLYPFSAVTGYYAARNRATILRQKGRDLKPPVIVVGNLVAGGAGKTPIAIAIARQLAARGFSIGLVCGGVGASQRRTLMANTESKPSAVGDEAVLLARATGLPVAVGRDRRAAVALLIRQHPEISAIVSDDGLQHVGLKRTIELVVFDSRGAGNARLLPAGPLREPLTHLVGMDAMVLNTGFHTEAENTGIKDKIRRQAIDHPVRFYSKTWVSDVIRLDQYHAGNATPLIDSPGASASDVLERFRRIIGGRAVAAVAAIASPDSFFSLLNQHGIGHRAYPLSDHAAIGSDLLSSIREPIIIMTEKDAVKCAPDPRIYVLRIAAIPQASLLTWLCEQLDGFSPD